MVYYFLSAVHAPWSVFGAEFPQPPKPRSEMFATPFKKPKRKIAAILAMAAISGTLTATSAQADQQPACNGTSCNDLDPVGRCDADAITVAVRDVTFGRLELRYSPACVANWGRYTPYLRTQAFYLFNPRPISFNARVTVWNPGENSYGVAKRPFWPFASTYSKMTDGSKVACTGVEVSEMGHETIEQPDLTPYPWENGPCY